MIYTPMTYKAMNMAYKAHDGQKDRNGAPYIFHPYHVAESMPEEMTACAALLHDTVEDTDMTIGDIEAEFPAGVADTVRLMTHEAGVEYTDYIRRLKDDPAARMVKLSDLAHNSDQSRFVSDSVSEEKREKLRKKYESARAVLNEDFRIIAVTDLGEVSDPADKVSELLGSGADSVILRAKNLPDEEYAILVEQINRLCPDASERLVWHAHTGAAGITAEGRNRSQMCSAIQLPLEAFRNIKADPESTAKLPETVGVSVHSPEEAEEAGALGASYAVFGHIYPTNSKKGLKPRGLRPLMLSVLRAGIPVYAIGGITTWNISEIRDSGCAGACMLSGFMDAADPKAYVKELQEKLR